MVSVRFWALLLGLGLSGSPPSGASGLETGEPQRFEVALELQAVGMPLPEGDLGQVRVRRLSEGLPQEVVARVAARSRLSLLAPGPWRLSLEIPGFWTPSVDLNVDGTRPVGLVLNLWPTGTLAARLNPAAGPVPTTIGVEVQLPGPKTAVVECPVDPKKGLECAVPASRGDIVLRAKGFAPVYRRAQTLRPKERLPLGSLQLLPGASITGQVVLEDGRPPFGAPPAQVRLLAFKTQQRADPSPAAKPLAVGEVGLDGFFQLTGLAAGTALLEVEKAGFAPVRMFPLELTLGTESRLVEPLVLRKPLDLEFLITPAVDWLGRPWNVRIERAAAGSGAFENESVFDGPAPEDGTLRIPGQTPGRFAVFISDAVGNRFHSDPEVWIESAAETTRHVDIPLLDLRGRLFLGEEPVPGRLWFGGRHGFQAIEVEADEEGRFTGALPRAGMWWVEIATGEIETRLALEVAADGRGRAEVKIEIPDTHVSGRVVDGTGQPVEGADVAASTDGPSVRKRTGAEGRFELRGLPPGQRLLRAATRGREPRVSEQVLVTLHEGQPAGPVELVLRATEVRTGQVVSRGGPVAGASLTLSSIGSFVTHTSQAQAGAEGRFELRVDPLATQFSAVVLPPGGWLTAVLMPNDGTPLVIPAIHEGGTLEIESSSPRTTAGAGQPELVVFREGAPLAAQHLLEWLRGHGLPVGFVGDRPLLRVPRMATGRYMACLAPAAVFAKTRFENGAPTGPQVTCAEGDLTAGGTLRLRLGL